MSHTLVEKTTYPLLPLRNGVLFPHLDIPVVAGRDETLAAIEASLGREDKLIAVVAQKDPTGEVTLDNLHDVGTLGVITRAARNHSAINVLIHGEQRLRISALHQEDARFDVNVEPLADPTGDGAEVEAFQRILLEQVAELEELVGSPGPLSLADFVRQLDAPVDQVYLLATMLGLDTHKQQSLLAADTTVELLRLMHGYLAHEVQVQEIQSQIARQTQTDMSEEQREYLLRHQMQAIQEQLGEKSPEEQEVAELRGRLADTELPDDVRTEVEKELQRLERLSVHAPDYQVTRTHIELVIELPWKKTTEDNLDLTRAREILDRDHFDLKDVKDRIVEHLAVMKLNPEARSPILCFVGPPGVGKTSLGQSIAAALGRHFERQSLGGLHDESELRGHRRTYIGAMPGRIIEAIRRAGVKNPLLMLDEVDKLGRDFRGDPAAALMEVLDPAQNCAFHDNYLDVPFDLSRVFFITTANTLDSIPPPLLDRMEILRLPGYSGEEKREIARRYLVPRQVKESGLTEEQLQFSDAGIDRIIERYTREAGVRELERTIGRVARKIATRVVEGQKESVSVEPEMLPDILGPERFFMEEARRELTPGVAAGLAWTEAGGEVLYVESVLTQGEEKMLLTGQLGKVMQESARAARSYVLSHAQELGIDAGRVRESGIHIHVPAGATPKDGPSAGVTMVAALASLFTDRAARSDTAMTGEITLSGLVLPVGGIKEKVLAAHRSGLKRVVLPQHNRQDLRELPDHVREALEFIPVKTIGEVLEAVLPEDNEMRNEE